MTKNVSGNKDGAPVIAWVSPESRRRLEQICTSFGATPERLAGQLLDQALASYVRGRQRLRSATTTDDRPAADQARKAASRSGRTTSELAELKADFDGQPKENIQRRAKA